MVNSLTYDSSHHMWTIAHTPRELADALVTLGHKSLPGCKLVLFIYDESNQLLVLRTYNRTTKQLSLNHLPHLDVKISSENSTHTEERTFNALTESFVARELGLGNARSATVLFVSRTPAHKPDNITVFVACRVSSTEFAVMVENHEWFSEATLNGFYLNDFRFQLGGSGLNALLESAENWKTSTAFAKIAATKPSPMSTLTPIKTAPEEDQSKANDDGYQADSASDFRNDADGFTSDDFEVGSPMPELRESSIPDFRGATATLPATTIPPLPTLSSSDIGFFATSGRGLESSPSTPIDTDDGYEADFNERDDDDVFGRDEVDDGGLVCKGDEKAAVKEAGSHIPMLVGAKRPAHSLQAPSLVEEDDNDSDSLPDLIEDDDSPGGLAQPTGQLTIFRPAAASGAPITACKPKALTMSGAFQEDEYECGFVDKYRFAIPAEKLTGVRRKRRMFQAKNKTFVDRKPLTGKKQWQELMRLEV